MHLFGITVAFILPIVSAAAEVCDKSKFGYPEVLPNVIRQLEVKLLQSSCDEPFNIPRIIWTIEPAPDDDTNTTSVYTYPPNLGKIKFGDPPDDYVEGFEIDMDAIDNTTEEMAILIQAPKDVLEYVSVEMGMPFHVNILHGFTALTSLSIWGGSACDYYNGCPQCNNLFTSNDIKDIGPTVVADLSSVDVNRQEINFVDNGTVAFTQPIDIRTWGTENIYDLTITLPLEEEGVGVQLQLDGANANVNIKGNIKCDDDEEDVPSYFEFTNENYCTMRGTDASGCKDCLNSLTIDGDIFGVFNVSGLLNPGQRPYELKVDVSQDDGCNHFVWEEDPFSSYSAPSTSMVCTDGAQAGAVVDTEPLPCIGDTGTLDCGLLRYAPCLCGVPSFPGSDNYCPALVSGAAINPLFWASSFVLLAVFFL